MSTTGVRPKAPVLSRLALVWSFAQRDLKARYKGTVLGWTWSLLVPLATLAIFSVVFSIIFRVTPPPMGGAGESNFPLYLFAGLIVWGFFSNGINTSIVSLLGTGTLMKKIYFPAYAPVLGALVAVGFQVLIEVVLLLVAFAIVGNVGWTWLLFPLWVPIFAVFVASCSVILSVFNVWYRDLAHITQVALQLMFYTTPIIYTLDLIPAVYRGVPLRDIVQASPVTQFIALFREMFYLHEAGSLWSWGYVMAWSAVLAAVAWGVSTTRGRDLSEEL